jgi:hypothetical protein
MAAGADVTVTIDVTAPTTPGVTVKNKASVKTSSLDLKSGNNSATKTTSVT